MQLNKIKTCGLFPFTFFRSLVFVSLLAILILPIYTVFFLSPSFVNFIIEGKVEQAARLAAHMESKLIPDKSQQLTRDILTDDVLKKIYGTSKDFKLLKVRILFPSGEILFSNIPHETGSAVMTSQLHETVVNGRPYTRLTEKGAESLEGDIMPGDIVETYVPILRDNKTIGVFEIYYDITATKERLNSLLWLFYATLFPIASILLCAVIMSCRKANRNIIRRLEVEEKLLKQSAELKEKNEELTELFALCKDRKHQLETEQKARQEAQKQVQHELMKREKMRMELLRHTVQAQEEERSRIARELHDETAQTLTAASLNFATLKNQLTGNTEVSDVVNRLQNLCKQMNSDLYRLVHDLRPAQLDDLGLVPALRYLTDEGQNGTNMEVSLKISGKQQRLDPFVETAIFRIVQEALTNVTRHAGANMATVELNFNPEHVVVLRIKDEGKGFDLGHAQKSHSGWGLAGMAERAESINGKLRIESSPGKGTMVEAVIPLIQHTSYCPMPEIRPQSGKEKIE